MKRGTAYPLGYDVYMKQYFANNELILNSVDYLLDESGLIQARNKEIILRPMDKVKVKNDTLFYQVVNIVVPILVVILFAIIWFYLRKKKYEKFT